MHVVFGAGQVGRALAARLAGLDLSVRVLSRHRPPALVDGVDWRVADASDPDAATEAARGASVIYQCLNAPYTDWPERFPPLQRGVLAAAERTDALLVSLENLYGYGPTGNTLTEDLPLAATTVKGRTRAAMTHELLAAAEAGRVRVAIGRASDFFGAGITTGTTLGERVFANAVAGKRADFIGNPELARSMRRRRWFDPRLVAVGGAVALARGRYLRWGATDDELNVALPGDELVAAADLTATRALTVRAAADGVWPWIAQIGQGRGGFLQL